MIQANQHEGNEDVSVFKIYKVFVMKEKIIYSYLNMLVQDNTIFNGLVWVPKFYKFEEKIAKVIDQQGLTGLYY